MNLGFETTIYAVIIVLLLISLLFLLHAYHKKSKSYKKLKETEQIKDNIFTKITHEFRTPLTIITGLSKQLREEKGISGINSETYLNAIERQGKNLSELVNQLLDISNLQAKPTALEWKTGNIVTFVSMISETFQVYAKQKDIDLYFFSEESEIEADFVPRNLNKILYNLLGNAIKFSDEGTHIYVVIEINKKNSKNLLIKVMDHGRGISKEDLPHIFELFYRSENNGKMVSNGIGLTLTKQLVEAVGGTIKVESELGDGAIFILEFPIRVNEKIVYPRWTQEKERKPIPESQKTKNSSDMFSTTINENDPRTNILLVEDNKDIAIYIRSIFPENSYNVMYASNGETALDTAKKYIPDIIITDIIMPKKDGVELCKSIKSSPLLDHIPVVIISAKNSDKDITEGLSSGADGYLTKPFSPEELKIRVQNILSSRNQLKEKYHRAVIREEKKESEIRADGNAEFIRHATDIIYREMKNQDFTPSKLAQELAISVSQLNKRLNAIAGYPSSTYILQVKLAHAKKLLITQNKTIGEIAVECGIYDVNYFSRIFKKNTGLTPTQYRKLPIDKMSNHTNYLPNLDL